MASIYACMMDTVRCSVCDTPFRASVRALAEGRSVCRTCGGETFARDQTDNMSSFPGARFRALFKFYSAFWEWATDRSQMKLLQLVYAADRAVLLRNAARVNGDSVNVENTEIRVLETLLSAFQEYDIHKPLTCRRLHYATLQADWYYNGGGDTIAAPPTQEAPAFKYGGRKKS